MDFLDETLSELIDECLRFEEIHDQEGEKFHEECMKFGEAEGAEKTGGVTALGPESEVKDDMGIIRANSPSHLARNRVSAGIRTKVPGLRAKGLDDDMPYIVIPGRKGRKGEKVVVLGVGQKWTHQDPPITVHSDTDSESETPCNSGYLKSNKQQDVDGPVTMSFSSNSEVECHVVHATPGNTRRIRTRDGNKRGLIGAHDGHGIFTTTTETKRDESFHSEVKPRRFKVVKEEVVDSFQEKETNVDSPGETFIRKDFEKPHQGLKRSPKDFIDKTEKVFGDGRRSFPTEGKRPMTTGSAFVIKTEFASEDQCVNGKRSRNNRGENSALVFKTEIDSEDEYVHGQPTRNSKRSPTQSQPYPHVTEPHGDADLSHGSQSYHSFQNGETGEVDLLAMSPRRRVKRLREMFHERRRIYVKEEDFRIRSRVAAKETGSGAPRMRADLKAYQDVDKQLNRRKAGARREVVSIVGHVPGAHVGDYFFYRIELFLVGLHRQVQGGIDYITASKRKFFDKNKNPISVAVSVVAAKGGGYQNRQEGDFLMYTGQGTHTADQAMVKGNLALKNSCDLGLGVRVVRGIEVLKAEAQINFQLDCPALYSPSGFIYFYDGLYDVMSYHQEVGSGGFKVWKFKLVRQPGQRPVPQVLMTAV